MLSFVSEINFLGTKQPPPYHKFPGIESPKYTLNIRMIIFSSNGKGRNNTQFIQFEKR